MNWIGTIACMVTLAAAGCSAAQAPCPCDAEEVPETTLAQGLVEQPRSLADLPELFYSDSLHVWTWPDSLPRWQGPRAFVWRDSMRFHARPDTIPPGRFYEWADSLRRAPQGWARDQWDRRRAAWAAAMDPDVLIWPDTSVDARIQLFGPGVPPDAIRNFGEQWEDERSPWPEPRLFFKRRGPERE